MNTFIAKVIFQIICEPDRNVAQFDEQILKIKSSNLLEAMSETLRIAKQEECTFINQHGTFIQWKFIGVTELIEITGKEHGTELLSSIKEREETEGYIRFIKQKQLQLAEALQTKQSSG